MNPTYLQLFLLLNVFLIGVLTAIAARHIYAHFHPQHHEPEPTHPAARTPRIPPEVKEQMLKQAEADFKAVLDTSVKELQYELKTTTTELNKQMANLGNTIVSDEMKRYQTVLEELRKSTEAAVGAASTEVTAHQADINEQFAARRAEMEAKLAEEMAAEKQRLLQQIDTKLADAVASFLLDTLQHNVDLGAQSTYLTAMLEDHKAELAQGVKSEA